MLIDFKINPQVVYLINEVYYHQGPHINIGHWESRGLPTWFQGSLPMQGGTSISPIIVRNISYLTNLHTTTIIEKLLVPHNSKDVTVQNKNYGIFLNLPQDNAQRSTSKPPLEKPGFHLFPEDE